MSNLDWIIFGHPGRRGYFDHDVRRAAARFRLEQGHLPGHGGSTGGKRRALSLPGDAQGQAPGLPLMQTHNSSSSSRSLICFCSCAAGEPPMTAPGSRYCAATGAMTQTGRRGLMSRRRKQRQEHRAVPSVNHSGID